MLNTLLRCISLLSGLMVSVSAADRTNVLLICVDDLRPELACFGVDYIHSPNIDALAARGRVFRNHYVQAPTCGASRFTLLTGRYGGSNNGALFQRAEKMKSSPDSVPLSMPGWFRKHGYTTVSVGKVSHHPGGRGGKDWDDDAQPEMPGAWTRHLLPAAEWQHPRGWMHGLANGEIRVNAGQMDVFQAVQGPDSIYPDGKSIDESLRQLEQLAADDSPFFLAVGVLRPHLPFGAPRKYLDLYEDAELPATPHPRKPQGKTTWHGSGEFMKYNRWGRNPNNDPEFALEVRRHYAACVSYADCQVGRVLTKLKESGAGDNTVVVLWGDHGWHLGEHGIWGKHALFEESLRSPLVIASPGMNPAKTDIQGVVGTLDIFPTLCELTELPTPEDLDGRSLVSMLKDPSHPGHPAVSYSGKGRTVRTSQHRLILHRDGFAELYDHNSEAGETQNLATSQPEIVSDLTEIIQDRLKR